MNTYGYADQNPLRYIDPLGLASSLNSCAGHNAVACANAGISAPRTSGAANTGGAILCFIFDICSANESSEEGDDGGQCPSLPDGLVGEQDDLSGQRGGRHKSGPLAPEHGGTGNPQDDFDQLTGGTGRPAPDNYPPGTQIGITVLLSVREQIAMERV